MISPKKVYTYFNNEFSLTKSTNGWYSFKCPICDELEDREKMAVHFGYNLVKCWVCGYRKYVVDYVADIEDVDYQQARQILQNCEASRVDLDSFKDASGLEISEVKLPSGYNSILDAKGVIGERAQMYLRGRGFDLKELDRIGVGYIASDPKEGEQDLFGYILIPFKRRGKLIYYIGRDFMGNYLKYKNPLKENVGVGKSEILFNEDALSIYDTVFITEGWACAATIGRQGCSTQGWSLSPSQISILLRSNARRLVFVPDDGKDPTGEWFYHKTLEVASKFLDHKEVVVVDTRNNGKGKDVNDMGKKAFMKLYKNTEVLTKESCVSLLLN